MTYHCVAFVYCRSVIWASLMTTRKHRDAVQLGIQMLPTWKATFKSCKRKCAWIDSSNPPFQVAPSILVVKMSDALISTRLENRCAIITGASSGLGRSIALAFAANGAGPIVCGDLRPNPRGNWGVKDAEIPTHELICQLYGEGKAVFVQCDVTVAEDVKALVKKAVQVGGRLDV